MAPTKGEGGEWLTISCKVLEQSVKKSHSKEFSGKLSWRPINFYAFHALHSVGIFRLNCSAWGGFCEFFELPPECRGHGRLGRFTAAGTHSPWVGTMFAPLHTGFMSLHCSRWRHGIRAGYGIRGVRPGYGRWYTIALGTEKVQTEVQKQSEGSGNQG